MSWIIVNLNNPDELWSNAEGWTEGDDYDSFDNDEKETMLLPIGGIWEHVPWTVAPKDARDWHVNWGIE